MRQFCSTAILSFCALSGSVFGQSVHSPKPPAHELPVSFIENRGQWDSRAQYLAQMPGLNLWVTSTGVVYDFHEFIPEGGKAQPQFGMRPRRPKGTVVGDVVQVSFVGAHLSPGSGVGLQGGKYNYFHGKDKGSFIKHASAFGEVRSRNLYDGIDARYYFDQGKPRYDLIVRPGADPSQIEMKLDGAQGLSILPNGNLRIETPMGAVEEQGLTVYQGEGPNRTLVPAKMTLDHGAVRFSLGAYDQSKSLVIDPLLYGTYFGGSGGSGDYVNAVHYDSNNIRTFIAGTTSSPKFPVNLGSYQTALYNLITAGFVAAFDQFGTFEWCSYLEGNPVDSGGFVSASALSTDLSGNPIVAGDAYQVAMPTTPGVFQRTATASVQSGYLMKLSQNGEELLMCGYFGGNASTSINSLYISPVDGTILIAGGTSATDLPVTNGALQSGNNSGNSGGNGTGFAATFESDLSLVYGCTYLGGSGTDTITSAVFDKNLNILLTGQTSSSDFPTTSSAFQTTSKNNNESAFMTSMSWDCKSYNGSTYLSGSSGEYGLGIAFDSKNNPIVVGATNSSDFPITTNAFDGSYRGHTTGFVTKLMPNGSQVLSSTYLGGGTWEEVQGVAVNATDDVIVCGETMSTDFWLSVGAYQASAPQYPAGFIVDVNPSFQGVNYSSLYGANNDVNSLALVPQTNQVLVAGYAGQVPAPPGSFQTTNKGGAYANGFLGELSLQKETVQPESSYSDIQGGQTDPLLIQLSSFAPPGGSKVTFTTDSQFASVPTMVVPANEAFANVALQSKPVDAATTVQVTAHFNGVTGTTSIKILPNYVDSVSITPSTVAGGDSAVGEVFLIGPTGPSGVTVSLSSSSPDAKVPSTLKVAPGASSAKFMVTTSPVTSPVTVTITELQPGFTKVTATMKVVPTALESIQVPASMVSGNLASGDVTLTGPAPATGVTVDLKSSDPSVISVPATLDIKSKAVFPFTITAHTVNAPTTVTITAKYGTVSKSGTIKVGIAALSAVAIIPASVTGGAGSTGVLHLNGTAPTSGLVASMSSSDAAAAEVPATVAVQGGATSASFAIKTFAVAADAHVTISAKSDSVTKTGTLEVLAPLVAVLSVSPNSVTGGQSATGTVTLTGPAPAAGLTVSLSSDTSDASVPATIKVAAGKLSATFPVSTKTVSGTVTATLKAITGSTNKTTTLIIKS